MRKNMNFTPEELTPPNTCYADMHHVALDVKKGINEQIKLVAGDRRKDIFHHQGKGRCACRAAESTRDWTIPD